VSGVSNEPVLTLIDPEPLFLVDIWLDAVVRANPFSKARKPSIRLWIDFGSGIGKHKSSAQIINHCTPETLAGQRGVDVVDLPPRQTGPARSEVLAIGVHDAEGAVVLLKPEGKAPNSARVP